MDAEHSRTELTRKAFSEWIAELMKDGQTQRQIASDLGCSESALSRYLNGSRIPEGRIAFAIEVASKRRIRAADWYEAA